MALDRNQAGLLFKIDVDTMDGAQQIELFKGVVSGASAEIREQFQRMGSSVQQSFSGATRSITSFGEKLGEASTNQLRGFLGQFGMVGDAASDMIPALSGSSAAMLGLAGASVAAGAALAATAVKAMDYTGKVDDLAQVTNLTTETIQSLQLAATLSGQSFEEVSQTAVIFQKKIEEAKSGNEELVATFKALGVDLNGPVDAAFRQTLEKLNGLEDGSLKTAVSLDLFGKSGSKLLPVMDQVGGSFDGLITRAQELGIVLSEEDIAKSNEFADKLDILSLKMKGITNDVGVGLIDFLNDLGDAFAQAFDPAAADQMQAKLEEMQNKTRQEGTVNADLRARLEGVDTGANAPNAMQIALEEARRKTTATTKTGGGAAKAAKEEKEPRLDEEKIRREYRAYKKALAEEEQKLSDEREKLRIAALDGEEARLRDKVTQMEARLVDARFQAEVAAFERTDRAGILAQVVSNLEAEKALTQQAISEMEAARVRAMIRFTEAARVNTEKRIADEKAKELEMFQEFQSIREEIRKLEAQTYADIGFSPEASAAIVAQQEVLGRQLTMWEQMQVGATSFAQVIQDTMPSLAATMVNTSMAVSDALANMVSAFVQGRGSMRQVVGAFLDAALAPLRDYLMTKSKAHFALGIADLAMQNYAGAAKNFLAATALAGAAGLIKAGTSAISGGGVGAAGPIGPSGGGQFLAESRGGGGSTMREQGSRRNEPQVIIIRAETEPGVMVSKFVQDYRQNGEARGVLRRDLLGEY